MLDWTEEIQARFDQDGFVIFDRPFLAAATIARLHDRYEKLFRGVFETGVRPDEVNWQEGESDPGLTRQICNGWRADRTVARVVLQEAFGRIVARLMGWPGARIMIDNVLWKPPGARSLGYHQDSAYLRWFRPSDLCSLWIALDDTSADGGTMELVRGSHRWAQSLPEGEFHGPENYRAPMEAAAAAEGRSAEVVPVEVPAGGGSIHHGWTWHGSGPNRGERPRRSLVLHAMSSEAQFDPAHLDQGIGPIYGRYRHLDDNVMDENHFPILWRRDGYRTPGLKGYCGEGATAA